MITIGENAFRDYLFLHHKEDLASLIIGRRAPAQCGKLALQVPEAIVAMSEYWLPYRQAVYEREVAKALQPQVGPSEECPCGSGKKYHTCCGSASVLH